MSFGKIDRLKHYNAKVKGWSFDHLFIKVTDDTGFMTGASSWRQFEELSHELREKAKNEGYTDIKISISFA